MSRRRTYGFGWMWVLVAIVAIASVTGELYYAFSMVSPKTALHKVEDAGYTNVHIGSRHVWTAEWRCGKGYVAYFDFTATAVNGRTVHGRVCKGEPPFQGWRINY